MLTDIGLLVGVLVLGCALWLLWARGERRKERGLALGMLVVAVVLTGDVVRLEIAARRAAWEAQKAAAWADLAFRKQADFSDLNFRSEEALNELKYRTEMKMNDMAASAAMDSIGADSRTVARTKSRLEKDLDAYAARTKREAETKGAAFETEQKRLTAKYDKLEADLRKRYGPPPK